MTCRMVPIRDVHGGATAAAAATATAAAAAVAAQQRQPILLYRRGAARQRQLIFLYCRGAARQRQLIYFAVAARRGSGCIFGKFSFIFIEKTYHA